MTARLLVVASPTSSPLSTDVPIPTDGQPQWYRCDDGGMQGEGTRWIHRPGLSDTPCRRCVPDGPFPFTVAVWVEDDVPCCFPGYEHDGACDPAGAIGAIVGLVTVTGLSHKADSCLRSSRVDPATGLLTGIYCHPDALPDCWHTPTGKVTPIEPIPCERPTTSPGTVLVAPGGEGHLTGWWQWWCSHPCCAGGAADNERAARDEGDAHQRLHGQPASVWGADAETAARLAEVMA